jgi:hypothetical protein
MIIGLYDYDLITLKQPLIFNLELMKMSYLIKHKSKNTVQMMREWKDSLFSKIYVEKDYNDGVYPEYIISNEKVEFNGNVLFNGQYAARDMEFELCAADTSIYEPMKRYYQRSLIIKNLYKYMINGQHLRLSLNGTEPTPHWEKQIQSNSYRYFFHDTNLEINEATVDSIKWLKFFNDDDFLCAFKFPIYITSNNQLKLLKGFHFVPETTTIVIDCPFELTDIFSLRFSNAIFQINTSINDLSKILKVGKILSYFNVSFVLNISDDFNKLEKILNNYFRYIKFKQPIPTIYYYIKYINLDLQMIEKISLLKEIKTKYPELFEYFNYGGKV